MKTSQVDVDGVLRALGQTRFFHTSQCILICASLIVASTNSLFYIFYAITPEYRCNNLTESQLNQYNISINEDILIYEKCTIDITNTEEGVTAENRTLNCLNGYYYTAPVDNSIVSQWDLVCNRLGLAELTQTLYTVGQIVSGLLGPCLIEKVGRKPVRVLSHVLMLVFNLIASFSPSYWLFAAMKFLTGGFREIYFLSSVTLICELYPKEKRIIMSGIFMGCWGFYNSTLGLIAYLLKDYGWNTLFLFNVVISGYFLVDYFFLKESIRWLFANSKVKSAKRIIRNAAKQNNIDFDSVWNITLKDTSVQHADGHMNETSLEYRMSDSSVQQGVTTGVKHTQAQTKEESALFANILTVFKSPYLRKVTIVLCIEWAVNIASWNSIFQMMEVLAGNIYLNSFIMSLIDVFAIGIYSVIAKRFGHKISLQSMKTLAAMSVISASLIKIFAESSNTMEYVILVLYILTVVGLNAASCGDYIYTSELYPTKIRSIGSGFATTFTRFVCLASPFLKLLVLAVPWAPGIIIGSGCMISSILVHVFLPETGNSALPETIEDVNMMRKKNGKKNIKIQTIS
ncbi:organic anion transporter 3-like isoform X2 [Octopus bimaculoides]|uniref:organic anion transporter 3-like isoform X2 n=1 Tax=Octopus bimaculoides TaxID=37653 RepID=UPI0022E5E115|nr:organic anion transporter 3-like isoform X2 [Octopus bimaculoides]